MTTKAPPYQKHTFPCHPAYRQYGLPLDAVVVATVEAATHTEVGYFNGVQMSNQTVPGREVPMNHVEGFQVFHSRCNLSGHVDYTTIAGMGENQIIIIFRLYIIIWLVYGTL